MMSLRLERFFGFDEMQEDRRAVISGNDSTSEGERNDFTHTPEFNNKQSIKRLQV